MFIHVSTHYNLLRIIESFCVWEGVGLIGRWMGLDWNILEYVGIYWNILEYIGIYGNGGGLEWIGM